MEELLNEAEIELNDEQESMSDSLILEVCAALERLLSSYQDRKKGMRLLSKKIGVHEKTLLRILNKENSPGYKTILKIFRVAHNEFNDEKLVEILPLSIKNFVLKNSPQKISSTNIFTASADLEIQKNSVLGEIYILVGTGPLHRDEILYRFGQYGLEILKRMIEMQMIQETNKDLYILGPNQAEFSGDTIMSAGRTLIDSHVKLVHGEVNEKNFVGLYAEGLSEDAYQEWLRIDQEAFMKKFELSKEKKNLGPVRAFTFMVSETMEIKDLQ